MTYKFTNSAQKAIEIANDISIELGHNYIGTEHLLYGLVKEGAGIANKILEKQKVSETSITQTDILTVLQVEKDEERLALAAEYNEILTNKDTTTEEKYNAYNGLKE